MRTCVIFNPAAKGNKARHFRRHLDEFAVERPVTLKLTARSGHARELAAEAVREGFEVIAAAGGDGTLNEVVNGIGAADGFARARLGVLPLGTVNVFARELGIPLKLERAWQVINEGHETAIDLGWAEFSENGTRVRRGFVQLAGAGFDARAVELVHWKLKKKIGPLAYVLAGFRALGEKQSKITVTDGRRSATGELVLIGNGRLYGGTFRIFPRADLRDGLLDSRVFARVNWPTLLRCAPPVLFTQTIPDAVTENFLTGSLALASPTTTPLELDGEFVGHLPAVFTVERARLRVVVPATSKPAPDVIPVPHASGTSPRA